METNITGKKYSIMCPICERKLIKTAGIVDGEIYCSKCGAYLNVNLEQGKLLVCEAPMRQGKDKGMK